MRESKWITVMIMEVVLILVMMVMEMPPLRQGGEVVKIAAISPVSGPPERQDLTPLEGDRGFAAATTSINLRKNRVPLLWRDESVVKRGG
jgi:hypothetical protein